MPATIEDAISLAAKAHRNQTDKGGEPYIYHPLRVMFRMETDEERTAAVLHDVVEDTSITLQDLNNLGFSGPVVDAVAYLTKMPSEQDDYDTFIERVRKGPTLAVKVKLADLADNMSPSRKPPSDGKHDERVKRYERAMRALEWELNARERKKT